VLIGLDVLLFLLHTLTWPLPLLSQGANTRQRHGLRPRRWFAGYERGGALEIGKRKMESLFCFFKQLESAFRRRSRACQIAEGEKSAPLPPFFFLVSLSLCSEAKSKGLSSPVRSKGEEGREREIEGGEAPPFEKREGTSQALSFEKWKRSRAARRLRRTLFGLSFGFFRFDLI
jgi:hypothetical protein